MGRRRVSIREVRRAPVVRLIHLATKQPEPGNQTWPSAEHISYSAPPRGSQTLSGHGFHKKAREKRNQARRRHINCIHHPSRSSPQQRHPVAIRATRGGSVRREVAPPAAAYGTAIQRDTRIRAVLTDTLAAFVPRGIRSLPERSLRIRMVRQKLFRKNRKH